MVVCVACQTDVVAVDSISELCSECQGDLIPDTATTQTVVSESRKKPSTVMLTTEASASIAVRSRLGIVSAECVIGQHIFKDIAAGFRDFFGGRSKAMQKGLRDAKDAVLEELSDEAADLGADAVVAIQLHYASVGGAGSVNMLLLTATGTAVTLRH